MQAAATTSLLITGCSSRGRFAGFESLASVARLPYQVGASLVRALSSHELSVHLTSALIQFAEQAYVARDVKALEEISAVLMSLPYEAPRQIGLYYHALSIERKGCLDAAEAALVMVADHAPITYRARAIQGLGALYYARGQFEETLKFQFEALRAASDNNANDLQTTLIAHGEIAIVQALTGDHLGALANIQKLWPLVRYVGRLQPFYFHVFHNELAVELAELGRLDEAEAACQIALSSPYAAAYPEWSDTRDEIAAKRAAASPSRVALSRAPEPRHAPQPKPERHPKPARAALSIWQTRGKSSIQRPSVTISAQAMIVRNGALRISTQQVRTCRAPRPPPASSAKYLSN